VYGLLARRNAVCLLMALELVLNAVNLDLVAFDVWFRDALHSGQVFTLFVLTIAAAEVGVGLALVLALFRARRAVDVADFGVPPDPAPVSVRADVIGATAEPVP
jgi:NADH-quinone oxidoreductase subunit K